MIHFLKSFQTSPLKLCMAFSYLHYCSNPLTLIFLLILLVMLQHLQRLQRLRLHCKKMGPICSVTNRHNPKLKS